METFRIVPLFSSLALAATVAACARPGQDTVRWSRYSAGGPPPAEFQKIGAMDGPMTSVAGEKVIAVQPRLAGARIRGSWVRVVRDGTGAVIYGASRRPMTLPSQLEARIRKEQGRKPAILERMLKAEPGLARGYRLRGPELEVVPEIHSRLTWVVDYETADRAQFLRIEADLEGRILRRTPLGSGAIGEAWVFPRGPMQSSLSEVTLGGLFGDGTLSSSLLRVGSAVLPPVVAPGNVFRYDTQDHRFDEVQAYWSVDRALAWFKAEGGIQLPFTLDVQVHVGGIEKPSNSAFYYGGNIRLGLGDGKTWRDIPRDPSIVMHEASHAVVQTVAGLPFQGEGGSLNEAYADFFAASILENPRLGEQAWVAGPCRRDLQTQILLAERNGGLYHDSQIVSGALWELRSVLGPKLAQMIAFRSLARLTPDSGLDAWGNAVRDALQASSLSDAQRQAVIDVLMRRGWTFSTAANS